MDSGDADPFMEFIIGPGEAVIIPMGEGMSLTLAEELRPLTEASAANSGAAEEIS
ncbi:MAG: hypothetical protein K2Q10_03730 [Rhodospirillales bacterium]|nr:hypothetical protein [Rhodospirillales bacterium]